jgi:hypothetical protein
MFSPAVAALLGLAHSPFDEYKLVWISIPDGSADVEQVVL